MQNFDQPNQDKNLANPGAAVTLPPSQVADHPPEQTASPLEDTGTATGAVSMVGSQPRNEVVDPVDGPTADLAGSCLYFLVCADTTGDLAGLFKLGIADCLGLRHQQHQKVWGAFDLPRSAVLRVGDRWEARRLELALRDALGGSVTEGGPGAAKPWSTADFLARKSWRRYPGRKDEGYTEFYAVECLERALVFTEGWLDLCRERLVGACLQRGINPAEGALGLGVDGGILLTGRDRGPGLRERQRVRREREYAELEEQVVDKMTRALALALEYEERLLWVDLRGWQRRRTEPRWFRVDEGLVDLHFTRFGPAAASTDTEPPSCSPAQAHFEELLMPITSKTACLHPEGWRVVRSREVCVFDDLADFFHEAAVLHPTYAGALRLRVEHRLSDLDHPLFAEYEALARRVQDRHPWRQPELGW